MSRTPDVTVIMPVYNAAARIAGALDSIAHQTLGAERIQVILVDDGSTDETPAILDRWAAEHPSFEVIHQANSGGPANPRNVALEYVRGRYIFYLDEDDYLAPDALEAMIRVADENGTDVVVPRTKGVGGRNTPIVLSIRTMPRTDVFGSSAYWVLNPAKLFRTEMVRSLGLRFDEEFPIGEDVPFVARACIEGDGISVIADKDYLFWVWRDDGSNITTSRFALSDRLPGAVHVFELVASLLAAGPQRDLIMQRCFRADLLGSVFPAYRAEPDVTVRAAAFGKFRELVGEYYNERVQASYPPGGRVLLRLVSEGRQDLFAEYLDLLEAEEGLADVVIEGEQVFLALPWFRDPARVLPDSLFEVGANLRVLCRVEPLTVMPTGVRLTAACRFGVLTDRVTGVALLLRSRSGGPDVVVPLRHEVVREEKAPHVLIDEVVSAESLLAFPKGEIRDLYLRLEAGQVSRERKVAECAPAPTRMRVFRTAGGARRRGALVTTPKGYLTVRDLDIRLRLSDLKARFLGPRG